MKFIYSVVIPSNSANKLRRCVRSIIDTHPKLDVNKIIIVDDGAREGWSDSDPIVTWVEGVKPFVYARNVNLGIAAAVSDDLVIIGDDCRVATAGGFSYLAETSAKSERISVVSATIDGPVGNPHQRAGHGSGLVRESETELAFVCVYLSRRAIEIVGLLDDRFVGYGGEDVDWCWRAQQLGGRFLIDGRCLVAHNEPGMPSEFRNRSDIQERSRMTHQLLSEKWPERFRETDSLTDCAAQTALLKNLSPHK